MTFQPQPLRSHPLDVLIEFAELFVQPLVFRFQFVVAAQLSERLLNGEFGRFGHENLARIFEPAFIARVEGEIRLDQDQDSAGKIQPRPVFPTDPLCGVLIRNRGYRMCRSNLSILLALPSGIEPLSPP